MTKDKAAYVALEVGGAFGTVYLSPPSAPVGVEAMVEVASLPALWMREADEIDRLGHVVNTNSIRARASELERALAQQPTSDGGFTAADMMDARQEGRKEAQQPAAVDEAMVDRAFALMRRYDCFFLFNDTTLRRLIGEWMTAALTTQPGGSGNDR